MSRSLRQTFTTGSTGATGIASSRQMIAVTPGGNGVVGEIESSTGPRLVVRKASPGSRLTSTSTGAIDVTVADSGLHADPKHRIDELREVQNLSQTARCGGGHPQVDPAAAGVARRNLELQVAADPPMPDRR